MEWCTRRTYRSAHLALRNQAGPLVAELGVLVQDLLSQGSELYLVLAEFLNLLLILTRTM